MSKRNLSRRQRWRIDKIQQERTRRAATRDSLTEEQLQEGELGPEQEGLVIAHYGTQVAIEATQDNPAHDTCRCHFRANLGSLVTGDRVIWRSGSPTGVVVAVLPRHSQLSRPDPYGDMKTVAANIDRILIVIAPYPEPHDNLIDRYLVAAECQHLRPLLLLNKVDRIDDSNRDRLQQLQHKYRQLGYEWLDVSAATGEQLDRLSDYLASFTSTFVGQSGVGKSSLINTLLPDQDLKIGALSELTQKGTHTTTTAQLYHFPGGGHLIDSPGIREFGLWHLQEQDLLQGFIEFRPYLGHCKFRDCAHQSEPGCALQEAVRRGRIRAERMASFRQILSTLGS